MFIYCVNNIIYRFSLHSDPYYMYVHVVKHHIINSKECNIIQKKLIYM